MLNGKILLPKNLKDNNLRYKNENIKLKGIKLYGQDQEKPEKLYLKKEKPSPERTNKLLKIKNPSFINYYNIDENDDSNNYNIQNNHYNIIKTKFQSIYSSNINTPIKNKIDNLLVLEYYGKYKELKNGINKILKKETPKTDINRENVALLFYFNKMRILYNELNNYINTIYKPNNLQKSLIFSEEKKSQQNCINEINKSYSLKSKFNSIETQKYINKNNNNIIPILDKKLELKQVINEYNIIKQKFLLYTDDSYKVKLQKKNNDLSNQIKIMIHENKNKKNKKQEDIRLKIIKLDKKNLSNEKNKSQKIKNENSMEKIFLKNKSSEKKEKIKELDLHIKELNKQIFVNNKYINQLKQHKNYYINCLNQKKNENYEVLQQIKEIKILYNSNFNKNNNNFNNSTIFSNDTIISKQDYINYNRNNECLKTDTKENILSFKEEILSPLKKELINSNDKKSIIVSNINQNNRYSNSVQKNDENLNSNKYSFELKKYKILKPNLSLPILNNYQNKDIKCSNIISNNIDNNEITENIVIDENEGNTYYNNIKEVKVKKFEQPISEFQLIKIPKSNKKEEPRNRNESTKNKNINNNISSINTETEPSLKRENVLNTILYSEIAEIQENITE